MRQIFIPGTGWDTESVVTGFIKFSAPRDTEEALKLINQFEFDDIYPFTNIFWGPSPAAYGCAVVGFAGSYKQIEEDWNEWLWKFGQLLSRLAAFEAQVNLSCLLGEYNWKLEPKWRFEKHPPPGGMQGQIWGITQSPDPDFSIDPDWLAYGGNGQWTKFIQRWGSQSNEAP